MLTVGLLFTMMLYFSSAESQGNEFRQLRLCMPTSPSLIMNHRSMGYLHVSYHFVSSVVFLWRYYTYSTPASVNGSSDTGNCASGNNPLTCSDPQSSVLFDDPGGMPILTGLDGDMWASQLLTIQTNVNTLFDITFDFTVEFTLIVKRVELEVVMFNCPQWEIGAQIIQVIDVQDTLTVAPTSCDSLVRVCLSLSSTTTRYTLRFHSPGSIVYWLHLAEVTFWGNNLTCPPDIVITEPTTPPHTSPITSASQESEPTTENTLITLTPNTVLTSGTAMDLRSMDTTVITVVIVLILLLLVGVVVVVIFVLVLIALCKYHPKFTSGGAQTGTSAGEGEGQEYEQMDMGEGRVAVSDPTYMEVGEKDGKSFELQQNEAYATHTSYGN